MKKGESGKQLRIQVLKYNDTRAETEAAHVSNTVLWNLEPKLFALAEPEPDPDPDLDPG